MNSKAQFIIVAALLIGIMVTSLAVSIYLTATQHQEFRYQAYKEIIINIDKDFKRALARILALATYEYGQNEVEDKLEEVLSKGDINGYDIKADFNEKLSYWCQTLIQSYPDAGLQLSLKDEENLLECLWLSSKSFSVIYSELTVNLISYGLYGFVSEGRIQLNVTIDRVSAKRKGNSITISLEFHVEREYGEPVSSLSKDNYNKFTGQDTLAGWAISYNQTENWIQPEEVNIAYSAGGKYTITFTFEVPKKSPEKLSFYLVLRVRDERGILVVALANVREE